MTGPNEPDLRAAVLRRLDLLDELAGRCEPLAPRRSIENTETVEAELIDERAGLHRLTDGWRLLLETHQPDPDGHCATCPSNWRHRRWPCQVWLTASQHLLDEAPAPAGRRRGFPAPPAHEPEHRG
jgi:hypothetical protein